MFYFNLYRRCLELTSQDFFALKNFVVHYEIDLIYSFFCFGPVFILWNKTKQKLRFHDIAGLDKKMRLECHMFHEVAFKINLS